MTTRLDHWLTALDHAQQLTDLQSIIEGLRDHYDVSHMVYHWVSADGEQFGCGTYPISWAQHYVKQGYLRVDPVIKACYQRFDPVDWRDLDWSARASRQFRNEAYAAGVGRQGYSIPLHGPNGQFALFTVCDDRDDAVWEQLTTAASRDLIVIAHGFNRRALEIQRCRVPAPARRLSGRETDVLTFLAMGYSRGQIAGLLSISEHTLRTYIESARLKFDASNTIHAVARATAEGHIVIGGAARNAQGAWPGREQTEAAE